MRIGEETTEDGPWGMGDGDTTIVASVGALVGSTVSAGEAPAWQAQTHSEAS